MKLSVPGGNMFPSGLSFSTCSGLNNRIFSRYTTVKPVDSAINKTINPFALHPFHLRSNSVRGKDNT